MKYETIPMIIEDTSKYSRYNNDIIRYFTDILTLLLRLKISEFWICYNYTHAQKMN